MLILLLASCATSNKGDTGLLWIDDSLSCPLEDTTFTALSSPLTCEATPNLTPIDVLARTSLDQFVSSLPVTGQLTDDNGDGEINGQDTADVLVVITDGADTSLKLLSADTLSTHWSANDTEFNGVIHSPHIGTQLTIGMAELDAAVGIFGSLIPLGKSDICYLGRWELDGSLSWIHTETPIKCADTFPAINDMDGDGHAEILVDGALISADSGDLLQKIETTGGGVGYATDLDNDGQREWLDGTAVRRSNGSPICETGANEGLPASADLDGDGDGEFIINTEGELSWYHHDCTLGGNWNHSTGMAQPLVADIDGDGGVEIVIQTETELVAYERDGSSLWSMPVTSGTPFGPSSADIDGDEIAEIIISASNELFIVDGKTGTKRLTYTLDSTPSSLPYALELNGGGAPELVVTLDTGLWILELDNGGVDTDNISRWHQRSCAVGMQGNGWIIPSDSPSNFSIQNSFNSTASTELEPLHADIHPTLIDTCIDDCSLGIVTFTVSIKNTGASDITEGVSVNVLDSAGSLLHSYSTEESLKANHNAQLGIRVFSDEIPSDGLILSIDDDELVPECNESDNIITIASNPCLQ